MTTTTQSPTEHAINVQVWQRTNNSKKPNSKKRGDRRAETAGAIPSFVDDSTPKKLRDRLSRSSTTNTSSGHWRNATCRLSVTEEGSNCVLTVYAEDSSILHSVFVHLLTHTDIRPAHKSLFFRTDVLGIFCRPGQAFGLAGPPSTSSIPATSSGASGGHHHILHSHSQRSLSFGANPSNTNLRAAFAAQTSLNSSSPSSPSTATIQPRSIPTSQSSSQNQHNVSTTATATTTSSSSYSSGLPLASGAIAALTSGLVSAGAAAAAGTLAAASVSPNVQAHTQSFLLHSQTTSASSPYLPPLYIRFPSTEIHNTWLLLLRSYAQPDTYGMKAISEADRKEYGGLYRVWRGIEMELIEGRGLMAGPSNHDASMQGFAGFDEFMSPNPSQPSSKDSQNPFSSSHHHHNSHGEHDVFCELFLDSVLSGRSTTKRVPHHSSSKSPSSSTPRNKGDSVYWHESFSFSDLPPHGQLVLTIWKQRSSPHHPLLASSPGANSIPSSQSMPLSASMSARSTEKDGDGLVGEGVVGSSGLGNAGSMQGSFSKSVSSSIQGGVALISKRDREPCLVGTVEISLTDFRRGEWVDGWWSVIPAVGYGAACGEVKIRLKVDEEIILPSETYSTLSQILSASSPLDLLRPRKSTISPFSSLQTPSTRSIQSMQSDLSMNSMASSNTTTGSSTTATSEGPEYSPSIRPGTAPPRQGTDPSGSSIELVEQSQRWALASHLHMISISRGTLTRELAVMIKRDIDNLVGSPTTLFRGNTDLTKTVEFAMNFYGKQFLEASLGNVIRRLCSEKIALEIDISRVSEKMKGRKDKKDKDRGDEKDRDMQVDGETSLLMKEVEANVKMLKYWCEEVWKSIWNARAECPNDLRLLFQQIRVLVDQRWGGPPATVSTSSRHYYNAESKGYDKDSGSSRVGMMGSSSSSGSAADGERPGDRKNLKWQAISAFAFLRFMVPAILSPHLFGLVDGLPSVKVQRTLRLVGKFIQSLANLSTSGVSEEHLQSIRMFLNNQQSGMIDYLWSISNPVNDLPFGTSSGTRTVAGGELFDRSAMNAALQKRLASLPVLHREAIPSLPLMIDSPRHLAVVASTVVRNARGRRGDVNWSQMTLSFSPQLTNPHEKSFNHTTHRVMFPAGYEVDPEDFRMACFKLETEARGRAVKLSSRNRTRAKSGPSAKTSGSLRPGTAPVRSAPSHEGLSSFARPPTAQQMSTSQTITLPARSPTNPSANMSPVTPSAASRTISNSTSSPSIRPSKSSQGLTITTTTGNDSPSRSHGYSPTGSPISPNMVFSTRPLDTSSGSSISDSAGISKIMNDTGTIGSTTRRKRLPSRGRPATAPSSSNPASPTDASEPFDPSRLLKAATSSTASLGMHRTGGDVIMAESDSATPYRRQSSLPRPATTATARAPLCHGRGDESATIGGNSGYPSAPTTPTASGFNVSRNPPAGHSPPPLPSKRYPHTLDANSASSDEGGRPVIPYSPSAASFVSTVASPSSAHTQQSYAIAIPANRMNDDAPNKKRKGIFRQWLGGSGKNKQ